MDYIPVFDQTKYNQPVSRISSKILDIDHIPTKQSANKKPPKHNNSYVPSYANKENSSQEVNGYMIPQLRSNNRVYKSLEKNNLDSNLYKEIDSTYQQLSTFNYSKQPLQDLRQASQHRQQYNQYQLQKEQQLFQPNKTQIQEEQSFITQNNPNNSRFDQSVTDFVIQYNNNQNNNSQNMSFYENYMQGERTKNLQKYEQVYENIKRQNTIQIPNYTHNKPPLSSKPYQDEQIYQEHLKQQQQYGKQIIIPNQIDLQEQQSTMKQLYKDITEQDIDVDRIREKYQNNGNQSVKENKYLQRQEQMQKQQQQQQLEQQSISKNNSQLSFQNQQHQQQQEQIKEEDEQKFQSNGYDMQQENKLQQEQEQKLKKRDIFKQQKEEQELQKAQKRERARSHLHEVKKMLEKDDKREQVKQIEKQQQKQYGNNKRYSSSSSRQRLISIHNELSSQQQVSTNNVTVQNQNNLNINNYTNQESNNKFVSFSNIDHSLMTEPATNNTLQVERTTLGRECVDELEDILKKYRNQ